MTDEQSDYNEIDWDFVLQSLPNVELDLVGDDFLSSSGSSIEKTDYFSENQSADSTSSLYDELLQELLGDGYEDKEDLNYIENFFSGCLVNISGKQYDQPEKEGSIDVWDGQSSEPRVLNVESLDQKMNVEGLIEVSDDQSSDSRVSNVDSSGQGNCTVEEKEQNERQMNDLDVKKTDHLDPVSKKRKRQIRNKESALKSRERKKMYVRDLEIKSRYLETECRRLEHLLRFCIAENEGLRLHFDRRKKVSGVLMNKQESAVLSLESLLLGSLFWIMNTVCLFLLIGLPGIHGVFEIEVPVSLTGNNGQENTALRGNDRLGLVLGLALLRRRYKATRKKMKFEPLHDFSGSVFFDLFCFG